MAYINGNKVLFSAQLHDGYDRGFADGQNSMIDESKIIPKIASGAYISVDDVSEIPHEVACKVESANLLNYSDLTKSMTDANGMNLQGTWENGQITLTGTFNAGAPAGRVIFSNFTQSSSYNYIPYATILKSVAIKLPTGTYTFSANSIYENVPTKRHSSGLVVGTIGGSPAAGTATAYEENATFTVESEDIYAMFFVCFETSSGKETFENLSYTASPMLNRGATALPYTPYVKPDTVQVTRTGANLLPVSNNITFTQSGCKKFETPLPAGTYTFSGKFSTDNPNNVMVFTARDENNRQLFWRSVSISETGYHSYTVTTKAPMSIVYWYSAEGFQQGAGIKASIRDFQINAGTTALPYEPYNGQTLIPTADGTVEGMTSVSPYMNIFADTEGVNIEAAYRMSWGMQEERERFYNDFQQGKINVSISFEWLALDKANTTSIINALSDTASGQTLTLNLNAVNTAFETSSGAGDGSTSTEFAALVGTKTNWTIVLK